MVENNLHVPDDFQSALALNAPASEAFAGLGEAERLRYLAAIQSAGAVVERMARIDDSVRELAGQPVDSLLRQ